MSISNEIESLQIARNTIRTKMIAAGQANRNDKLLTLATNLDLSASGLDTSDATATADDIMTGKTAYVNGEKITGNIEISTPSEITKIVNIIFGKKIIEKLPFATATDAQITDMLEAVRNGDISITDLGWKVGDKRPVHISAMEGLWSDEFHAEQDQELVILHGSNNYDLDDGGKNLFVIGLQNCLNEYGKFYEYTRNGNSWEYSDRKDWLDLIFMKALPEEVQKWFKKFKCKVSNGDTSKDSSLISQFFTFPSLSEVFGTDDDYYHTLVPESEDSTQLDYYKIESNLIKTPLLNGHTYWSLRSPAITDDSSFVYVTSYDSAVPEREYSSSSAGMCPFGCV